MKTRIYIDIDGVLLKKGQMTPEGAPEFIEFIVDRFECFWLTTHCRARTNRAVDYLTPYYDVQIVELLRRIKPTEWDTLKTEAIDFNSSFYWLEDYPFEAEIKLLKQFNKFDSLIRVDLNVPHELERIQGLLKCQGY